MPTTLLEVSIFLEVHDAAALRAAALAIDPDMPQDASLAECARILLHPEAPAGADILESTAQELDYAA